MVRSLTPSAQYLRHRFGIADSGSDLTDVFAFGHEVNLTVKYGSDRLACNIAVEPVDNAKPYLPKEEVSEILDEFAPPAMRGKGGFGETRSSACGGMVMGIYENVFITRWPNYCSTEHPGTESKAVLEFTRDVCPNPYVHQHSAPANSR